MTAELTFPQHVLARAAEHPDREFVQDPAAGYSATYAEHLDRVLAQVAELRALGVRPDEPFAVLSANSHPYLELWHAALFGGGVILPLNHRLVCAVVRLAPGADPVTEQEIREHARRSIAGYEVPKRVVIRKDPFPLSGANKVAKQVLRDEIGRTA